MNIVGRKQAAAAGLTRYFTGKPCPRGHLSERLVSTRGCLACARQKTDEWAERNRDQLRATKRRWREVNADRVLAARRAWRAANPEKVKRHKASDYQRHSHQRKMIASAWAAANPELVRYYSRAYIHRHPERASARSAAARARRLSAEGIHTGEDLRRLFVLQGGKCAGCGTNLKGIRFHVDHKHPLVLGGSNWPENLQLLCASCNLKKGTKSFTEWLALLGGSPTQAPGGAPQ